MQENQVGELHHKLKEKKDQVKKGQPEHMEQNKVRELEPSQMKNIEKKQVKEKQFKISFVFSLEERIKKGQSFWILWLKEKFQRLNKD